MKSLFSILNIFTAFVSGILGGVFIMLLGHPIVRLFQGDNPLLGADTASEVISVANTYIVFTTFIFVLITILVTGAGIWFSKWFSITKEKEIRENMRDFFDSIDSDSKLCERFVKELFEHREIAGLLHKLVQARVEEEISLRESERAEGVDFTNDILDTDSGNEK